MPRCDDPVVAVVDGLRELERHSHLVNARQHHECMCSKCSVMRSHSDSGEAASQCDRGGARYNTLLYVVTAASLTDDSFYDEMRRLNGADDNIIMSSDKSITLSDAFNVYAASHVKLIDLLTSVRNVGTVHVVMHIITQTNTLSLYT